ncbi:YihY/virulence factor BrkB family protein [Streptomyces sp. RB6PN25]|uniref:YihY/virulence factor BrkB family protein n=1 Tax=Streptomyces humicola TaxID=2953240 RepID=A0ABT1PXY7_9ACTN|nr:YihY/virulence factor BrkB family protein [Streptomyces humicola]MCQ4082546.1 YihY/virulence factor BrkB family protein [Streptomyces humicola]
MDWLTRLPWIGPWIARLMRTHAWRAVELLQRVRWSRLAAAVTFTSFLALFPLITLGAAIGAAFLTPRQLGHLEQTVAKQLPGVASQVDIGSLAANAGTVGAIAAALLFFTGMGWVGSLRGALRAVWEQEDVEENPLVRKVADGVALLGLGIVGLASFAASALATTAVGWGAGRLGLAGSASGTVLLTVLGYVIAVAVDFLLLAYLLTLLPGVHPGRRTVVVAALMGAVGVEVLKVAMSGYLRGVAGKSMYGAFGTPVALLLWINFMAKLLLFCAAWTATQNTERRSTPTTG